MFWSARWIAVVAGMLAALGGANANEERSTADGDEFVCNGLDSREVLIAMRKHGVDLSRPREALFYFYGLEDRLSGLQRELEQLGFTVEPAITYPGRVGTIIVATDEGWLGRIVPKLCDIAARNQCTYDGWEASVTETRLQ